MKLLLREDAEVARRSKVNMDLGLIYMVSGTRDNPPPSYPGRANFSPVSLASSTNRSHEDHQLVKRRRDNSAGGGGERGVSPWQLG